MTAVSSLGALLDAGASAQNQSAPAATAASGKSFASLLDPAAKHDDPSHRRAYGFSELGMFGLHAIALVPDAKTGATASSTMAVLSGSSANGRPQDRRSMLDTLPWAPPPVPAPLIDLGQVRDSQLQAVSANSAGSSEATAQGVASAPEPAADVARSGGADARSTAGAGLTMKLPAPLPQKQTASPVNVVVSGPQQALKIAVRAQGEFTPEQAKLRRLIEVTVAQFEMDVAELHFNGSSSKPTFSMGGGINGGRAR